jgi:ribonuclease D
VPRSAASLTRISELPEGIATRSGPQLLDLVSAAAIPDPAPPLPQRHRPEPAQLARVARLGELTRKAAQTLAVAAEILATRRELEKIAAGDLKAAPLVGWRRAVIGEALLQAL